MSLKVAINGFGRIGRSVARALFCREGIDLVAVNDIADIESLAYLLQYDSVYGKLPYKVSIKNAHTLLIDDKEIAVVCCDDPVSLDFSMYQADIVFECSGKYLCKDEFSHHIDKGIKHVILSAPFEGTDESMYVIGINEKSFKGEAVLSNASCTINALALVSKLLDDAFGIEKATLTTIHSYTNDQNLHDSLIAKETRRLRAAAINMIPTYTQAPVYLSRLFPHLKGKISGHSVRVPTPDVSLIDMNVYLKKQTTAEVINALFEEKEKSDYKGLLCVDTEKRVSQDFVGSTYSAIVAKDLTEVVEGDLAKLMIWYDNETGYSNRMVDLALYISKQEW